jgi:molecular chaperone GrpE (heat shock protein)
VPEESAEKAPEADAKKGPAQAFDDLRRTVERLCFDVQEIQEYTRQVSKQVLAQPEALASQTFLDMAQAMFVLHDSLFAKVMAMEAGTEQPDEFTINLLSTLENELENRGVVPYMPQPGEPVNMTIMHTVKAVQRTFWRRADTVSRVHRCAFIVSGTKKVLRKAQVDVYRDLPKAPPPPKTPEKSVQPEASKTQEAPKTPEAPKTSDTKSEE